MDIIIMDHILQKISFAWLPLLAPVLCFTTLRLRMSAPAIFFWPWFPACEYVISTVFGIIVWLRYLHVRQVLFERNKKNSSSYRLNRNAMFVGLLGVTTFLLRTQNTFMPDGTRQSPSIFKRLAFYLRLLLPMFPSAYCVMQLRLTNKTASDLCKSRAVRLARNVIVALLLIDVFLLQFWELLKANLVKFGVGSDGQPTFIVPIFLKMQPYYGIMYHLLALLISVFVSTFSYEFYGARIVRRSNQKIREKTD